MGCPKKNIPHADGGCAPGCPPECLLAVAKSEEAASASATAAAKSAALAQELLKNCLSDSTIAEGGGLVYTEGEGISVDPSAIIEENGGLAVSDSNKLYVDFSNMSATDLGNLIKQLIAAGGGLSINSDGQMYVDFSSMSSTQLNTLITEIVQEGGGLSVDENGQIYVDFDSMPTDKFEAMLKSLTVPIFLTSTKTFYVNCETGSDDLDEGRGESTSLPFKTIQACVDYVTTYYNINSQTVYIRIYPGTYTESIELGEFQRTTGSICLAHYTDYIDTYSVIIENSDRKTVSVAGGEWYIYGLVIVSTVTAHENGIENFNYCVTVTSGTLRLSGCDINQTYEGDAPTSGTERLRTLHATGTGVLYLASTSYSYSKITVDKGNNGSYLRVLYAESSGQIKTSASNSSSAATTFTCDTNCDAFVFISNGSLEVQGGGTYRATFVTADDGAATGYRYYVTNRGLCQTLSSGDEEFFPGDTAGYVQTSTYSVYS